MKKDNNPIIFVIISNSLLLIYLFEIIKFETVLFYLLFLGFLYISNEIRKVKEGK
jgi:hypothetical protein